MWPNESRESRQPLPFLFAMHTGDSLLSGLFGARSRAAAAPLHVRCLQSLCELRLHSSFVAWARFSAAGTHTTPWARVMRASSCCNELWNTAVVLWLPMACQLSAVR